MLKWVLVDMRHGEYGTSVAHLSVQVFMMHIIKFGGQIVLEKQGWRPDRSICTMSLFIDHRVLAFVFSAHVGQPQK